MNQEASLHKVEPAAETELDEAITTQQLVTAIDIAIKDLSDIAQLVTPTARKQVDECRKKLREAVEAAIQEV